MKERKKANEKRRRKKLREIDLKGWSGRVSRLFIIENDKSNRFSAMPARRERIEEREGGEKGERNEEKK